MATFTDIIGADDIFGADIFGDDMGADIALGADPELDALLSGDYPIVGTQFGADIFGAAAAAAAHPAAGPAIQKALAVARAKANAARGGNTYRQANRDGFMRTLAGRHAAAVVPRPVTKGREYPLGFGPTAVPAGSSVAVITQPQVPFRGRRLIVPSDIAGAVLINDLKVGKNSMFAAAGPVPARGFTEFGVGVDLNLDTAQISQQVSLSITNTSGAAITFTALLIGTAVE